MTSLLVHHIKEKQYGKEVKNITNAVYEQGEHNVTFDAAGLNPGMYLYTMTAGNYVTSKKFNVVK